MASLRCGKADRAATVRLQGGIREGNDAVSTAHTCSGGHLVTRRGKFEQQNLASDLGSPGKNRHHGRILGPTYPSGGPGESVPIGHRPSGSS